MKWRLGISAICLLALFAFFQFRNSPPDPIYNGRPVSAWVQAAQSADPAVSSEAAINIYQIGAPAARHLGKLLRKPAFEMPQKWNGYIQHIPLLRERPQQSTELALGLLTHLEDKAAPALSDIIPLLGDSNQRVVQDTEHLLRKIGPAAGAALAESLLNSPEPIRASSAEILREYRPTDQITHALIRALSDKSASVRSAAAQTLGVHQSQSAASPLLSLLRDPSAPVRARACEALAKMNSSEFKPELPPLLHDPNPYVQLEAAKALWKINRDPASILAALTNLLSTPASWQAAYTLAEMREAAAPAVPALIRAIQREQVPRPFRSPPSATFALGQIGAPAIPALLECLTNDLPVLRLNAAMALGFMQKKTGRAELALIGATHDARIEVREAAAVALGALGSKDPVAIKSLAECLNAEDIFLRSTALSYLHQLAPETQWVASTE